MRDIQTAATNEQLLIKEAQNILVELQKGQSMTDNLNQAHGHYLDASGAENSFVRTYEADLQRNPTFLRLLEGGGKNDTASEQQSKQGQAMMHAVVVFLIVLIALISLFDFAGSRGKKQSVTQDVAIVSAATISGTNGLRPGPLAIPTVGLPHEDLRAPISLAANSGTVGGSSSWNIAYSNEEDDQHRLVDGQVRAMGGRGSSLVHFGYYPGENCANVLIAGSLATFGSIRTISVNDTVDVTTSGGQIYTYKIVPFDPASGRKESIVSDTDDWVRGIAPRDVGKGKVKTVNGEVTLLIALEAQPGQPAQSIALRGVFVGTKTKKR